MLIKFKRINDLRVDNDMTMKQLAKILNISEDSYYDYEHGRSNFPLDKLSDFANLFEVSFDYITNLSNVKNGAGKKIDYEILKQRLKTIRLKKGLSQEKVAKILGDRQSTYWNYENGVSLIPIAKLYMLAKFYQISIDYFLGKTDNPKIIKAEKVNS